MEQRTLGKTGRDVSVVGLGTWQLGADWGNVDPAQARAVLAASAEAGVTFFDTADVYDALDTLVSEGAIRNYGVSVERTDEALEAIRHEGTASVQIILNAFRLKPLDEVLPAAKAAGVGIIARVPLASGLLTGKYSKETSFAENDHRNYNRNGESFDVGETFSGVDYELGLKAVAEFEQLVPSGATTAQAAIAWIAAQDGVTTVIPGARNVEQAAANAAAASVTVSEDFDGGVRWIYDHYFR